MYHGAKFTWRHKASAFCLFVFFRNRSPFPNPFIHVRNTNFHQWWPPGSAAVVFRLSERERQTDVATDLFQRTASCRDDQSFSIWYWLEKSAHQSTFIRKTTKRKSGNFLFPIRMLQQIYRGYFLEQLYELIKLKKIKTDEVNLKELFQQVKNKSWVIDVRGAIKDPSQVLEYLGRYMR